MLIVLVDQSDVKPEGWEEWTGSDGSSPQKGGGTGAEGLGVGCTETEAQKNVDVEMFGKQMDTQTCADQLSYSMKRKA